jgi:hypothetical protein
MWCEVLWTADPLPMHRSFYDDVPNKCGEELSHNLDLIQDQPALGTTR